MSINIGPPKVEELRPRIAVIGVGGAGGNAIANMIRGRSSSTLGGPILMLMRVSPEVA